MGLQRHVIKRQTIEITLAKQAEAWPVQQALSRIFRQQVPAVLDRCLTEASQPEVLHRIERLEIDLGELDADRLEADLLDKLVPALRQALKGKLNNKQAEINALAQHLQLIEQFLREGTLPWWADNVQRKVPENSLNELLTKAPKALRQLLIKLMQEPRSLQRLIAYFDEEYLLSVLALISAASPELIKSLLKILSLVEPELGKTSAMPQSKLRFNRWLSLLQVAVAGEPAITQHADFLNVAMVRWARLQGMPQNDVIALLRQLLSGAAEIDNPWLVSFLETDREKPSQQKQDGGGKQDNFTNNPLMPFGSAQKSVWQGSPEQSLDQNRIAHGEREQQPEVGSEPVLGITEGTEEGVDQRFLKDDAFIDTLTVNAQAFNETDAHYIDNAGLCILWPYLNSFFENLELVENGRFINPAAQQCAVSLLHYVATGDTEPPEFMLPFNKLLCGMAREAVYEAQFSLSDTQLAASDEMLAAVIANAPVLNDISLDGFRGSFLLRQGSLSADVGCWLLRVERVSYDIVLEHFPWTWQWFKLPWMEFPVRVEW